MIFDGRCGFCRIWIDYWKKLTGDAVDFAPSQEVADQFPQIPREAFAQAVQLVRVDGTVASGARAVFETLGRERLYESSRLVAAASETAYSLIARHRDLFYWLTRLTFGTRIEPARFAKTQWLFLRLLAVIYAIAFGSLATQIVGLVGARGIAPVHDYLNRLTAAFGATLGSARFLAVPTIFWWNSSDAAAAPRRLGRRGSGLAAVFRPPWSVRWVLLLPVRAVSVAQHGRPGVPLVPMGLTAAGGRISGDFFRPLRRRRCAPSHGCTAAWCSGSIFFPAMSS